MVLRRSTGWRRSHPTANALSRVQGRRAGAVSGHNLQHGMAWRLQKWFPGRHPKPSRDDNSMRLRLLTGAFLALAAPACAAESPSLVATLDNDSFINGIDRHYTNGVYLSWTGAPEARADGLTRALEGVMLAGSPNATWREGYFFGQNMFTPEDIYARNPPLNDRPYAGWLYGGARLYRDNGTSLDRVEATLGVVGPMSLA